MPSRSPTVTPSPDPAATALAVPSAGAPRTSYSKDKAQLLRRLSRLEGQVRGISRMIERDEYCIDILQQTAALRAAIDSVSLLVLEDHVAGCLRTAVETGDAGGYTEEVMEVVRRSLGRPVRGTRPTADQ
jgi:DNA-binding FrmR family transcriptional regulator